MVEKRRARKHLVGEQTRALVEPRLERARRPDVVLHERSNFDDDDDDERFVEP